MKHLVQCLIQLIVANTMDDAYESMTIGMCQLTKVDDVLLVPLVRMDFTDEPGSMEVQESMDVLKTNLQQAAYGPTYRNCQTSHTDGYLPQLTT